MQLIPSARIKLEGSTDFIGKAALLKSFPKKENGGVELSAIHNCIYNQNGTIKPAIAGFIGCKKLCMFKRPL
jgi:hypothetical protein